MPVAVLAVSLVAGCAGGPTAVSSTPATPTNTGAAPSATIATGDFADAPALVGSQYGGSGDALTGPRLPLVYRQHPSQAGVLVRPSADETMLAVSPSGEYSAVLQEATAVAKAAVRIESVATGEQEDLVELRGQRFGQLFWAPDSRAVAYSDDAGYYVHRIDGATSVSAVDQGGRPTFSGDDESTAVVFCSDSNGHASVITGQAGATAGVTEEPGFCDSLAQAVTKTGDPVGLYVVAGTDRRGHLMRASIFFFSFSVDVSGLPSGTSLRLLTKLGFATQPCGGTIVRFEVGGIYDIDTGVITMTPPAESCPVPSPDHARYAVATSEGPVVVISAGANDRRVVAEAGSPIAWSADGSQLVVEGRGTFLVKADGSGARPASVQVNPSIAAKQSNGLFCRAGDTGKAVLVTSSGPVLYDVSSDTAVPLPEAATGDTCWLTPNSRWLVTGALVVDVENNRGLALLTPGQQSDLGAFGTHRWVGPQLAFSAGRKLR